VVLLQKLDGVAKTWTGFAGATHCENPECAESSNAVKSRDFFMIFF
jgi:hypothetical protein